MTKICLGLGSNIENRLENLQRAVEHLSVIFTDLEAASVYESPPYGYKDQNSFYNSAVTILTRLSPSEVLSELLTIEKKMGRERLRKWGPRNIDLDIIFFGNEIVNTHDLNIPHPDYKNRLFVLEPVAELMGGFIPPDDNRSLNEILLACRRQNQTQELNKSIKKIAAKWIV